MFVEATDFLELPCKIPNQEESKSLDSFILKNEELALKKILGLALYNEFIAGLFDEDGAPITSPDQKWVDLRDGEEYEYSDVLYEYKGVKDFLLPIIYSEWVRVNYRKWTNSGMIVNKGQTNSDAVNPFDEVVQYWNEFVTKVGYKYNRKNTLYGFLKANESDYEDLLFHCFSYQNSLNL